MTVQTATGTRVYIGPQALSTVDTIAEFAALSPWTEVGEVESVGEFGDESALATFTALNDSRVRKLKAARDAGVLPLVCGRDPLDAGQQAMIDAEGTKYEYAIRVDFEDAPSEAYIPSTYYFRALITSKRENVGANDNVIRRTFNIAINSEIFEDMAALS